MKRTLLALLIALGTSAVAQAQPTSSAPDNKNGPVITFAVQSLPFDSIIQGTVVEREFTFKNTGKAPLIITDVSVGCGCTVTEFPKEPIAPGKSGKIRVTFNSANNMGPQDKAATVKSNSTGGDVVLHLTGKVIPNPNAPAIGTPIPSGGFPVNK